MMKRTSAALGIITTLFLISCQKDVDETPPVTTRVDSTLNTADKIKDSVVLVSRDVYLWNAQIPASFNAASYTDPAAVMQAIRAYSIEPGFTEPVDRFSFAIKKNEWDNLSTGVEEDFGMSVFFNSPGDLRVKYAEQASPSGLVGIQRGWQILKINGSTDIDTSTASINRIVDAVFNSSNTSFTFKKPDGTTTDITLSAATYQTHPVFADSVYVINNNKVGYLALNSFLGDTTEMYNEFNTIFNSFQQKNINSLIIDLRYNGGGYVSMAEKLADYLVPDKGNGQTMYTQTFNSKYSNYNETATFHKLNSLNLNKIFFIVSDNTASASELLINALKPFLSETLVGPATHTYGKPVGFFPIPVGDWYAFPVSFKTVNKDGNGDYFNGFTIDHSVKDGVDKNWGDREESCLKTILDYFQTGTFGFAQINSTNISASTMKKLTAKSFKGAVVKRRFKH
jgi:carboxyl-terminal processing protease